MNVQFSAHRPSQSSLGYRLGLPQLVPLVVKQTPKGPQVLQGKPLGFQELLRYGWDRLVQVVTGRR